MLSQAIQNARALATQVARVSGGSGPIATTAQHATNFDTTEVPELNKWQASVYAFASNAVSTVDGMISKLNSGTPASQMADELNQLKTSLEALSGQVDAVDQHMSSFRTLFSTDVASLTQYAASLEGDVKKYQSLQAHYQQEYSAIKTRIDVINGISSVFPIAKLVSELASLIDKGKSTETALQDAQRQVINFNNQRAAAANAEALAASLSSTVSQLATAVQNARNAVSIVEGKLGNEKSFIDATDNDDAVLYLNALNSSAGQLQQLAA